MYERFTDRARRTMQLANQEAQRLNHEYIGTEHILIGLIKADCTAGGVLRSLAVDDLSLIKHVRDLLKEGPEMVTIGKLPQTPSVKKVIECAIEQARLLNHNYVGTEHILLGLIAEGNGIAWQVLSHHGLTLESVRNTVVSVLAKSASERVPNEDKSVSAAVQRVVDHINKENADLMAKVQENEAILRRLREIVVSGESQQAWTMLVVEK